MKLISYSSAESGGMLGGRSSKSVTLTDDGRCQVHIISKPMHSSPTRHVRYYADGLLEKLGEVCERGNVITWTDLPDSEIFMHDAASGSTTFTFENHTVISLDSRKVYPENAGAVLREIADIINESESYGADISITEEEPFQMNMGMMAFQMKSTEIPVTENKNEDTSAMAEVCDCCGTAFTGNQKFCSECGAPRKKL